MTTFAGVRRFLLDHRDDDEAAVAGFRWPDASGFSRARAVLAAPDQVATCGAARPPGTLRIVSEGAPPPGWASLV